MFDAALHRKAVPPHILHKVTGKRLREMDQIAVGQIYADAKPPKREWRVRRCRADDIVLERVDKTTVSRFIVVADLRNSERYVRKE
jgi:hypothetical protein